MMTSVQGLNPGAIGRAGGLRAGETGGINPGAGAGGALDFDGMLRNAAAAATAQQPVSLEGTSLGAVRAPGRGDRLDVLVGGSGASMEGTLRNFVGEVNAKQAEASGSVNSLLSGEKVPLHQTMIKIEEAGVAFQLMVEVRNKLMESYQELMRMQI